MSDLVLVAIITGAANILAVVISRIISHYEHRHTAQQVQEIHVMLNGKSKVT